MHWARRRSDFYQASPVRLFFISFCVGPRARRRRVHERARGTSPRPGHQLSLPLLSSTNALQLPQARTPCSCRTTPCSLKAARLAPAGLHVRDWVHVAVLHLEHGRGPLCHGMTIDPVARAGVRVPPLVRGRAGRGRRGAARAEAPRSCVYVGLPLTLGSGKKKQQQQQDVDGNAYASADRVAAAEGACFQVCRAPAGEEEDAPRASSSGAAAVPVPVTGGAWIAAGGRPGAT